VTAIDRDGLLQGPDLELLTNAVSRGRGRIIASAGISSAADITAARSIGCAGAIVGRALYEGRLSVRDAIAAAAGA
jgi:phosphoribosylformimino-5-aminoimidazole carboxamide ribotide isomerase